MLYGPHKGDGNYIRKNDIEQSRSKDNRAAVLFLSRPRAQETPEISEENTPLVEDSFMHVQHTLSRLK